MVFYYGCNSIGQQGIGHSPIVKATEHLFCQTGTLQDEFASSNYSKKTLSAKFFKLTMRIWVGVITFCLYIYFPWFGGWEQIFYSTEACIIKLTGP